MRRLLAFLALLTSVLAFAPGAVANDTPCMGTLTGTRDNVVVPPGQTCILNSAVVTGNVKALQDSRLQINGSTIGGNVEGDKADIVQILSSRVRENIIIKEAGPPVPEPLPEFVSCTLTVMATPCEVFVSGVTVEQGSVQVEKVHGTIVVQGNGILNPIRGNIKIEDNFVSPGAEGMSVGNNQVAQNLQVFKNKGPGNKFVSGNTVGESLQCFDNDPPFVGLPNLAREVQGQCSAAPLP